jgi:hypothetical protein
MSGSDLVLPNIWKEHSKGDNPWTPSFDEV